jgi:hypothetical protein
MWSAWTDEAMKVRSSVNYTALPRSVLARLIRIQVQAPNNNTRLSHIKPSILNRRLRLTELLQRLVLLQGFASSLPAFLVRSLENPTAFTCSRFVGRRTPGQSVAPSGKSLFRGLELLFALRLRFELGFEGGVHLAGLFEAVVFFAAEAVAAAC